MNPIYTEVYRFLVSELKRCDKRSPVREPAISLLQPGIDLSLFCGNPEKRRFLFHAFYVPSFWKAVIRWYQNHKDVPDAPMLWLGEAAACVVAQERMLLEFVRWTVLDRLKNDRKSAQQTLKKLRRTPVQEWFADPPRGHLFWLWRFNEWLHAATQSFTFYVKKQCPDLKKPDPDLRQAAFLAATKHWGTMPDELFGKLESDFLFCNPEAGAVFLKNEKRLRPARWDNATLDSWLTEIWPLVTLYGWSYRQVWLVANWAFDTPEGSPFEKASQIEDRCKKELALKLGAGGRRKYGRPRRPEDETKTAPNRTRRTLRRDYCVADEMPIVPAAELAAHILSIAEEPVKWVEGKVGARILPTLRWLRDGLPTAEDQACR